MRAATRRALLVLAAGGDPHRDLSPSDRAVASLARDLDSEPARRELSAALSTLQVHSAGLPRVGDTLDRLVSDVETAWVWLALVLLADELTGDHPIE